MRRWGRRLRFAPLLARDPIAVRVEVEAVGATPAAGTGRPPASRWWRAALAATAPLFLIAWF
jgi:hypothetical protein